MPISPETLDRLQALAVDTSEERERAWRRIVVVGEALSHYPPRSHERRELSALISDVLQMKSATQRAHVRVWRVLNDNPDGIRIPFNLHPSTVRVLADHGATWQDVDQADADGMTLAQARAWARGRTVEKSEKPVTLWKHLTHTIGREWRKRERLSYDDLGEFIGLVRDAAKNFAYEMEPLPFE